MTVPSLEVEVIVSAPRRDHAVGHGQAEPGAFARRLGREERLECTALGLVAHSVARVSDRQCDSIFVRARADGQRAAVWHGIAGIAGEVEQYLLQLRLIGEHRRQRLRQIQLDGDVIPHELSQQVVRSVDKLVQVEHAVREHVLATERQ